MTCIMCGGFGCLYCVTEGVSEMTCMSCRGKGYMYCACVTEAEEARDEGMARAESRVSDDYRTLFQRAVRVLAASGRPFDTDDVRGIAGDPPDADHRAIGPLLKAMQREGIIRPTGQFRLARSVSRHRAPLRLWEGV